MKHIVPADMLAQKILLVRGCRVMLDSDLAALYGVETKYLLRQVRRNIERFPSDFMLALTKKESLRCHSVTSNRGGRRYLPYVFTEQGVAMLSSVLNSKKAIEINIVIMRAFVRLRELVSEKKDLSGKLAELERKYDTQFRSVFDAIRGLMEDRPVEASELPKVQGFRP